jgi:hypothetical protein
LVKFIEYIPKLAHNDLQQQILQEIYEGDKEYKGPDKWLIFIKDIKRNI